MKKLLLATSCLLLGLPLVASQTPSDISLKSNKPTKAFSMENGEVVLPEGLSRSQSIPIIKAAADTSMLKASHPSSSGGSPSRNAEGLTGRKSPHNSPKPYAPYAPGLDGEIF